MQGLAQLLQARLGVADDRQGLVLSGVEAGGVQADEAGVVGEQRPGAGGEVLQARADRQHHVGLGREMVGRVGAQAADRAGVEGMVVDQDRPAGDGLDHGDTVALGEAGQRRLGTAVAHAAAGDQQRLLGGAQEGCRLFELAQVGARAGDVVDPPVEEAGGIVEGLGLHVLAQADEGRAAVGGVEQHSQGLREGLQQLLGPGDPVPVAGDRLEGVVDAEGGIAPVLDLLQHRVGQTARRSSRPRAAGPAGGWCGRRRRR